MENPYCCRNTEGNVVIRRKDNPKAKATDNDRRKTIGEQQSMYIGRTSERMKTRLVLVEGANMSPFEALSFKLWRFAFFFRRIGLNVSRKRKNEETVSTPSYCRLCKISHELLSQKEDAKSLTYRYSKHPKGPTPTDSFCNESTCQRS